MLYRKEGRRTVPATDGEILSAAQTIATNALRTSGAAITSPRLAQQMLALQFAGLDHEVFAVMFLDARHRLIAFDKMFRGTLDGASVHPREVVKAAIGHSAAAVVLCHNHPSGNAEPSRADEAITIRLRDALALIDVRVVDHVVIAGNQMTSLAERGLL